MQETPDQSSRGPVQIPLDKLRNNLSKLETEGITPIVLLSTGGKIYFRNILNKWQKLILAYAPVHLMHLQVCSSTFA